MVGAYSTVRPRNFPIWFLNFRVPGSECRHKLTLQRMRYGILELTAATEGGIPDAATEDFMAMVQAVGPAFGKVAEISGVDQLAVECILAQDFVKAVETRMRRFGEDDREAFTTERVG